MIKNDIIRFARNDLKWNMAGSLIFDLLPPGAFTLDFIKVLKPIASDLYKKSKIMLLYQIVR
jgi:hypothetical protein